MVKSYVKRKGMMLSEREALDELLSIYTARGRDKTLPISIIMDKKQLKDFAEAEDINGRRWRYRGFLLERIGT